jgi:hypothetical protein
MQLEKDIKSSFSEVYKMKVVSSYRCKWIVYDCDEAIIETSEFHLFRRCVNIQAHLPPS